LAQREINQHTSVPDRCESKITMNFTIETLDAAFDKNREFIHCELLLFKAQFELLAATVYQDGLDFDSLLRHQVKKLLTLANETKLF